MYLENRILKNNLKYQISKSVRIARFEQNEIGNIKRDIRGHHRKMVENMKNIVFQAIYKQTGITT